MQLNYKEQIVISCNKLYIQDIFSGQKFSIKNLSQKFVYVSAILSNIDNYTLNKSQFILQSRGECIISIKPKIYDKISKFNFVNNKIFVICLILQKQTCIQKIDLEKELKSLWIKQILIEVNCENILQIHQQTRVKLKKVAKITRYNKKPLTQVQFGKIQKVCEKIGEIIQILDAQSIILIKFSHAVQIIPKLYIGKGYLFTLSYLSTQTGKQNINLDKQIKHNVPQITNLFVFEQLIVCYNQNNLYIINQFSKEVKQFTLAKNEKVFSSSRYICIVIHDQYVKIFQNYEKINITKVQIRYLKIQYLCQFHQSMYVSGVNQNNKFNQQKNQLFLIQKFNLKKSVIIPDYKFTIIQENLKIEKFIAYKNSLIIFWKKGFCIYSLRKKQIIVKIKKEIHQLNLLLGKQSYNYLNCIGLNLKKELFFINIQKYGQQSFGSEVFQYQKHVQSYCQSPSGKIYLVINNSIYQYFVKNRQVQSYPIYKPTRDNLIKFIRSFNEDHLIVYIETKSSSWFVLVQIQKKKYQQDLYLTQQ